MFYQVSVYFLTLIYGKTDVPMQVIIEASFCTFSELFPLLSIYF